MRELESSAVEGKDTIRSDPILASEKRPVVCDVLGYLKKESFF